MRKLWRILLLWIILLAALPSPAPASAGRAANLQKGIQPGAPVDDAGNVLISAEIASQLAASNAGYVRLNLKNPWCADTPEFYAAYDTIIGRLKARGLTVIALLSNEFLCGGQAQWNEDAWEVTGGDSYNLYIDQFGYQAGRVIAHYRNAYGVRHWEIWNEPNCYSSAPGVGCSYIWPSILSRLLGHVYTQAKYYNAFDVEILSGGLLGHNLFGNNQDSAGATYLRDTYTYGIQRGDWSWIKEHTGSYPLDHVGYHTYLGSSGAALTADLAQYLGWIRAAYTTYEGANSPKQVFITEIGWRSDGIGEAQQAANLTTAFGVTQNTPYVAVTTWFFLRDQLSWAENWGLLRADGTPKPAWQAFGGSPPPTCSPVSLPVSETHWRLELWETPEISGTMVDARYEATGDNGFLFDWGEQGAGACVGADHFGVRFTRRAYFPLSSTYVFTATASDGVRLWVDGSLALDAWWDQDITPHRVQTILEAGWHTLQMDYYENTGAAYAALSWADGNGALVLPGQSVVPAGLAAGESVTVTIRVQNTGSLTWQAADLYRLAAAAGNTVAWQPGACGGYAASPAEARQYLCHDVAPGQTHDFTFRIAAPPLGEIATLALGMTQDAVGRFGESQSWLLPVRWQIYLPVLLRNP